jgi:NAD(P)-dependent dehydrogenase (short-subunit alcohol dehydrogenase family)
MTLNKKRIVVLGGSSGIGLAVAQAAAREGASPVIVSSNRARVDAALKSLPNGAQGHAADLGNEAAIQALFEQVGDFDHLIYTAGENLQLATLDKLDLDWARGFFGVRYWGALAAVKHGAPHIRLGGSVSLISDLASTRPHAGWSVASSICSAMEGLTRSLAVELAPIRVNIVSPGIVKSPLWDAMPEAERDALYKDMADRLPLRHVGAPEEVAQSYIYLMKQTYGTGQVIGVDGGGAFI